MQYPLENCALQQIFLLSSARKCDARASVISTHFGRAGMKKAVAILLNTKLEKVMTNQMGDNEIELTGEHRTPEQREHDRWLTMARCSIIMTTAKSADERMACVKTVLDKFRDVPNQQPSQQDTAAFARFAAKAFLEALVKTEGKQSAVSGTTEKVHSVATENVFNEWIDEWLPPSHATRITLPRM
jgi:hypothetical protein